MLEMIGTYGRDDLAMLYVGRIGGEIAEWVESVQPPVPRDQKWVLIVSTLFGCPLGCAMCDAGQYYRGAISAEGILAQIDHMVLKRFPDGVVPVPKFKIQFARMGEPALNDAVLEVLRQLPQRYDAPGLMPCISTVAPCAGTAFLEELIGIKNEIYGGGRFQLQFSIHSTDDTQRRAWMPGAIWGLDDIAAFVRRWYVKGDRGVTLNFAVADDSVIDPAVMARHFDPEHCWIKLTPVNPTDKAVDNGLVSGITVANEQSLELLDDFQRYGFTAAVSIGAWEENAIGSNCGQFATRFVDGQVMLTETYKTASYVMSQ